ncbi:MAG: hypothetical protein K2R93_02195 [Gemmatimonadaceae bacterium]|nr:hypothetical protein [Gemmatimonadaceae bacterium]
MTLFVADDLARWHAAHASYPAMIAAHPVARLQALDRWYREELPAAIRARDPMTITHEEMVKVTEWKMARGVWRAPNLVKVKANTPDAVDAAGRAAAAQLGTLNKAIGAFTELDGVGPATASAVLAIMDPSRYPFFDEEVAKQVPALGPVAWTLAYYRRYAEALVTRAQALGSAWSPVMVEQALWAHHRAAITTG